MFKPGYAHCPRNIFNQHTGWLLQGYYVKAVANSQIYNFSLLWAALSTQCWTCLSDLHFFLIPFCLNNSLCCCNLPLHRLISRRVGPSHFSFLFWEHFPHHISALILLSMSWNSWENLRASPHTISQYNHCRESVLFLGITLTSVHSGPECPYSTLLSLPGCLIHSGANLRPLGNMDQSAMISTFSWFYEHMFIVEVGKSATAQRIKLSYRLITV